MDTLLFVPIKASNALEKHAQIWNATIQVRCFVAVRMSSVRTEALVKCHSIIIVLTDVDPNEP